MKTIFSIAQDDKGTQFQADTNGETLAMALYELFEEQPEIVQVFEVALEAHKVREFSKQSKTEEE